MLATQHRPCLARLKLVMKETIIYLNPTAGSGRAAALRSRLEATVPGLSAARWISNAHRAAALDELDEQLTRPTRRVLAIGGDGTAHVVANRLLKATSHHQIPLGIVPAGTGSDLARFLRLPKDPERALRAALAAAPRAIDALRLETGSGELRYVVNVASGGVSGTVARTVNALPRRGPLSYLSATIKSLWSYRGVPCRVLVDGQLFFEGAFFLVAVANGRYFGKGMKVAPEAACDDHLADVVLVPPMPLWRLPDRLPQFIAGWHLRTGMARFSRARQVRVEPEPGFPPYDLDGESLAAQAVEISVVPNALQILG